jgi:adenosylmethionine-8-amino-7-oxononanoate aminotransferase
MMCAVEYVKDRATKEVFAAEDGIGAKVNAESMERGMFSRVRGDAYFIAPPIVTENDTIDRIVEIMAESTKAVLG